MPVAPRPTIAPPVATAGHGDECEGVVTRTGPAATCELAAVLAVVGTVAALDVLGAAALAVDEGADVAGTVVAELLAVGGGTCSPVVDDASVDVDDAGGAHVVVASGDPFGGGSLGFPAPCGWNRQPSTVSEWIREPPAPTFE